MKQEKKLPMLLGVYALNNVSLVDKPFGVLNNTVEDLANRAIPFLNQTPIAAQVINAIAPSPGMIIKLGADVASADDLAAIIDFNIDTLKGAIQKQIGVMGVIVSQKFMNNKVTAPFQLEIRAYDQFGQGTEDPIINEDLSRSIQVEPTAGANSASEYLILFASPGYLLNYEAGTENAYTTTSDQNQGYASILNMAAKDDSVNQSLGLVSAVGLVFKDQESIEQTISVTPLIVDAAFRDKYVPLLLAKCAG